MISATSPFKAAPRISESQFVKVLELAGSFDVVHLTREQLTKLQKATELTGEFQAEHLTPEGTYLVGPWLWSQGLPAYPTLQDAARHLYRIIESSGHDPAVWLAICGREHTFGTHPDSVLSRNDTRSWTNARTIRTPLVDGYQITDAKRGSQYIRYKSVIDSIRDGIGRIEKEDYVYQQRGATTIAEIIAIWVEDAPEEYIAYIVSAVNSWIEEDTEEIRLTTAQIPGFIWEPADDDHFTRGRGGLKIEGGAQHYSAGTNSLAWLTRTSGRTADSEPVSAHFLIKHEPTMEDRGWQLVRIEDTAWATGPYNKVVVAIEYEHTGNGPIPDIAYEVIAQTWVDVATYAAQKNLGEIVAATIKGHREWMQDGRVCPDGVSVPRIRDDFETLMIVTDDQFAPILFHTGYELVGALAGFYRLAAQVGIHWSAIGVPIGEMRQFEIEGIPRLIQETDVNWIVHTPSTGETRMATNSQREAIEGDELNDNGVKLDLVKGHLQAAMKVIEAA